MSDPEATVSDDDRGWRFTATGPLTRLLRRQVLARLGRLERGGLSITDALGSHGFGRPGGPQAQVRIGDLSTYADIAAGGTIGAAEAYMCGKWTASDLTALVRLLVANRAVMTGIEGGLARLTMPLLRFSHWWRRNSRAQARRNISAHYDLGNEFYRLFLDDTMSYSSAIYPRPDSTLEEAAVHKLDVICRKLDLGPGDELLEIGTGWGALALHAAGNYGCRVTTTTISARQRDYARERVRAAGLAGRIEVLDRDYRDLEGQFDKLVSVEMIEAVGLSFLDEFFRVCSARLRPNGRMLLQGIVIADRIYDQARQSVDFIQKYIFPGGALPSLGAIQASVTRATHLQLVGMQDIGQDYARTLREWRRRFLAQLKTVRRLGYSEEFIRMWEYYLAYCEGGFLERAITNVQAVFDKPGSRLATVAAVTAIAATGATHAATPDPALHTRNPSLRIQWAADDTRAPPFDKVLLAPIELEFRPVTPPGGPPAAPTTRSEYPVPEKDQQELAEIFQDIFRDELGRNRHYALTDQPGAGVLLVKPSLRDIVSRVPPEEPPGRSAVYIDSVADATLVLQFADAATGETLGTATDRRTAEPAGTAGDFGAIRATKPMTTQELRRLARRWATSLDQRLEQIYFEAKPK